MRSSVCVRMYSLHLSCCLCVSVCLSVYPSIYPSLHPSIHSFIHPAYPYIYIYIERERERERENEVLCKRTSLHPSIHPSIHPSMLECIHTSCLRQARGSAVVGLTAGCRRQLPGRHRGLAALLASLVLPAAEACGSMKFQVG